MSIQPQDLSGGQQASRLPAEQFSPSPSILPSSSQRQPDRCPACRAPTRTGQAICAGCAAVLHRQPTLIRCRHCGQKGSSAYALCPHCGRAMAAAPPVWLAWGLPAALVLLVGLALLSQMERGPLRWVAQGTSDGVAVDENPILTPVRGEEEGGNGEQVLLSATVTPLVEPAALPTERATERPTDSPTLQPTHTPEPTITAPALATQTATARAAASPTATPSQPAPAVGNALTLTWPLSETLTSPITSTQTPSAASRFQVTAAELLKSNIEALKLTPGTKLEIPGTGPLLIDQPTAIDLPGPTATPSATQTPEPSPTATAVVQATEPVQKIYTVVSGDIPMTIAQRFNISTEALLAANGLTLAQARSLYVGQKLIIPSPGQPTATATPGLRPYTVLAGDTVAAIAARNGISASLLLAVNQMTATQALAIRPGDELLIPPPGYTLPTPTPRATRTPTITPTPTVTIRLQSPRQIDPDKDVSLSCGTTQYMKWYSVDGLLPGDEYIIFLGYVNSAPDANGQVEIVPLLAQRTQRTDYLLNPDYCGLASQEFGRRWRWYIQIFNGDSPVSPPSESWEFSWR